MKKVCFETFGCRLNRAEALKLEAEFIAAGWIAVDSHADADVIVVRGCSVTSRAQRDSEKLVGHLREKYPHAKVIVTGCMKQAIDARKLLGASRAAEVSSAVPMKTSRAYLKIQDGCNSACAFCIVPQFRGSSVSVDFQGVLDEAKRFIDAGYHELVVTGCNLAQYSSEGKRLPEVLSALAELDAGVRVRLGSLEPCAIARPTLEAMAAHANICRYVHLPIQSGSATVLMRMRRPYRIGEVNDILSLTRKLMPRVGLGCDLMTGFPGERDVDFNATVAFLRRGVFSKAHVFPYSERPMTAAARMTDIVPRELRRRRAEELAAIADLLRKQEANKYIGQHVEVVIEDVDQCAGWTGERFWFRVDRRGGGGGDVARRSLVKAIVRGTDGSVLTGEIV